MKLAELAKQIDSATATLSEQSKAFALWIMQRMDELCIKSLKCADITNFEGRSSTGPYECLFFNGEDLSSTMGVGDYLMHGEYGHIINRPTRDTVLEFIRLIPEILAELEELSQPVEFPAIPT